MTGNKRSIPLSKLPRLLQRGMTAVVSKKPTRLELMKEQFHRQMMRDKERVIIEMYEVKQRQTFEKVAPRTKPLPNNRPTGIPTKKKPMGGIKKDPESPVRKFVRDGSEGGDRKTMAEIQAFYKRSYKVNAPRRSSVPMVEKNLMKRSAGKDRNNLLPPLARKNGNEANMPPKRVPLIPPIAKDQQNNKIKSYSAPSGSKKPVDSHVNGELSSAGSSSPVNDSDSQPDLAGLENLKRRSSVRSNNGGERRDSFGSDTENDVGNDGRRDSLGSNAGSNTGNDEKHSFMGVPIEEIEGLSDFHKWKLEQMRVKEEKLYKKALKTRRLSSESDDGLREEVEERLLSKQNELLAELAERQRELDKMQEQRLEKERREAEESEKRAAIESEKIAKLEREAARREEEKRRIQDKRETDRRAKEDRERRARALAEQEAAEEEESQLQNFIPHPPAKPRTNARRPPPRTYTPPADNAEELEEVAGPDVDFYRQAAEEAAQNDTQSFKLKECKICGRRFAQERLQKHEGACKTANKKRKIFDPVKMRLEGTEANQFHWKAEKKSTPSKPKKDWRKQHDEFRKTIQHAKKVGDIEKKGGDIRTVTPLPPAENPDYIQCPHCERRFNSTAAERHIPKCKDIKGRPLKRR